MKIGFIENVKYSETGFDVLQGHKGEVREVAHTAACRLLKAGKAYNAEEPVGNHNVAKALDDIQSIICQIDHWHNELHRQIDDMNRFIGETDKRKVPVATTSGTYTPGMTAVLKSEQDAS